MRVYLSRQWLLSIATFGLICFVGCGGGDDKKNNQSGNGVPTTRAKLNGSGATFVEPAMQLWSVKYEELTKEMVIVDYQGTGSGTGVTQMIARNTVFGCSDAPLSKSQLDEAKKNGGEVVHIPIVVGAVVLPYNLPELKSDTPLILDGPTIAEIFSRKITKWNDAKIGKLNPGVNLPDKFITVVVRADSSGTSAVFSEYLGKVSPEFGQAVPSSTKPNWKLSFPTDQGEKGFDQVPQSGGVIRTVQSTPGAITYVELSYAIDAKLPFATIRNARGKDVTATLESISAAADAALKQEQKLEPYSLHQLTYSLTNADSDAAYPLSTLSYCVFYNELPESNGKALIEFLKWATKAGQELSKEKHYAPLPGSLQEKIIERLGQVKFSAK